MPIRFSDAAISLSDHRVAMLRITARASSGVRQPCSPDFGLRPRSRECWPPRQWIVRMTSRAASSTSATMSAGLAERRLPYAVGIMPVQQVYPADVTLAFPEREATGRPRKHPVPSAASAGAAELIEARPAAFRAVSWRTGTKGPLKAEFAALRVRVADGPAVAGGRHLPGDEAWLVGEHRASGERKYYLSNLPPDATLETLAALIKGRWVCEQLHQQLKDELGLDHFEGRSWRGLHHRALLCLLAFAFLQHLRLGEKSVATPPEPGPPPRPSLPAVRRRVVAAPTRVLLRCPGGRQRCKQHRRP